MSAPEQRALLARWEKVHGRRPRGLRYQRVLRGVYLPADAEPTLADRCAAALLIAPADAVITGVTALQLHGITVGNTSPIRLASATALRRRTAGISLSRTRTLPEQSRRVARPVAAWVDACRELDLVEAVAAADWLVRLGRATGPDLVAAADAASGRGCRTARRAAQLTRSTARSPKESELRLLLTLAGLPEPRCNVSVGDDVHRIAEVDLLYDDFRVAVEYEGDQHRTDGWQWSVDIERMEELIAAGYAVIRVTAARMRDPRGLVHIVHDHLRRRGYAGPAPHFPSEWSQLFDRRTH
ncbi:hypothetical protein [Microlunatus parietis]|uniref:DUF559 domain-containing protein n=1 Tax=Microlunatus parietis TaxID=682979 RepID=A0A7Y9I3X2_9ACTN|nr:hypothetical protein [Microlunatus parietis]NYE69561.1 hypothetical protein [Microlunatus parietis]